MGSRTDRLIVASASVARARLLAAAGVDCIVDPAVIDEAALKERLGRENASADRSALVLAEAKARVVSHRHPGALVIGADQILVCDGAWFDKPSDLAAARRQLTALRGRTHRLETAVCAVRDGARVWQSVSSPALAMRVFSDAFLDDYLAAEGEAILGSVGAYRLEGRGIQLFERIDGDYFAVLGLPLLALLGFLRRQGRLGT
jgi:septum formation protein